MTTYATNHRRPAHKNGFSRTGIPSSSKEDKFVHLVTKIIREQIDNAQFDVSALAEKMHLSVSQLNRKLNAILACPAGTLIRDIRMQHAAYLLSTDTNTIGEIAFRVGYQDQANFCRCFKQKFGCPPSQYLKRRQPNR